MKSHTTRGGIVVTFEPSSLGIIHMGFVVWPGVSTKPGTFVERGKKEGKEEGQ